MSKPTFKNSIIVDTLFKSTPKIDLDNLDNHCIINLEVFSKDLESIGKLDPEKKFSFDRYGEIIFERAYDFAIPSKQPKILNQVKILRLKNQFNEYTHFKFDKYFPNFQLILVENINLYNNLVKKYGVDRIKKAN